MYMYVWGSLRVKDEGERGGRRDAAVAAETDAGVAEEKAVKMLHK